MKIIDVNYHRNGVAGNGFHSVFFNQDGEELRAIVFSEAGNIAVISNDLEEKFRGDLFEDQIRKAISEYESKPL